MNIQPRSALAAPVLLHEEFRHLRAGWWWFLLLGLLLALGGLAAIIFPTITVLTSFVAVVVVGVSLMLSGVAVIVAAFWAGKWSGLLVQLLVGILYVVAGFAITEAPAQSAALFTVLIASMFIVVGLFRTVAALVVRFPHWGWALLNGVLTLLCGIIIYRHFPGAALWAVGLLVGIDMLFQGWTWIMLSLAIRSIPAEAE
jgi:uncharacterized membrane protein HdeD (DUF308 family)